VGTAAFFAFASFVWGPLYMWMVVAMLIWGWRRGTEDVRRMYILSPLLLACSMGIPVILISMPNSVWFLLSGYLYSNHMDFAVPFVIKGDNLETSLDIGLVWLVLATLCILFGYAFVGAVLGFERAMNRRGWFKAEPDASPVNPM